MWGLWSTEIITFACRPCPDKGKATADVSPLATHRRASLYIGGVWIRQPTELEMKRLLGLLLVMVGCGEPTLEELGAKIHQCWALRFQESKSNSAMQLVFSNEPCQRLQ